METFKRSLQLLFKEQFLQRLSQYNLKIQKYNYGNLINYVHVYFLHSARRGELHKKVKIKSLILWPPH